MVAADDCGCPTGRRVARSFRSPLDGGRRRGDPDCAIHDAPFPSPGAARAHHARATHRDCGGSPMKAAVYTRYGPPEVVQVQEVPRPEPGGDEMLVRIRATTLSSEDCTFRRGSPFFSRLATGLTQPKTTILGTQFSGEIAEVGASVTRWRGDEEVFGDASELRAHAEYLCLPESAALAP
ncbi:MAG: alcohol dehydrogenase catalytic domain-containing protein, partial [Candidatus Eisenbacteria bacterium]|nr:alcohol dehydrogenase catalytic domain-containing protein [Candidatus Eisenbacteria bacterium]